MGLQIDGWIEVWNSDGQERWQAVVNVSPLVWRVNQLFIQVFGITPAGQPVGDPLSSLAAARGIPQDASPEVAEWDPAVVGEGYEGHTWILWSELAHTPWGQGLFPTGEPLPESWRTLFAVMARLAEQYGAEYVRLAVWFN